MKYLLIKLRPDAFSIAVEDFDNTDLAIQAVGLVPLQVDHGVVARMGDGGGIGVIVNEFGLFDSKLPLWTINGGLYADSAVLYQFDEAGNTVSFKENPLSLRILPLDPPTAETMIERGMVRRPQIKVNGLITWQWPQPMPAHLNRPH